MATTKNPTTEWNGNKYYTVSGYWGRFAKTANGKTMTILMHREVMSAHFGRPLARDEHVHHKDKDRKNNDLSNLELLSAGEHARHHAEENPAETVTFVCDECGQEATKFMRHVRGNRAKGKAGPFCSRTCAGRRNRRLQEAMGKIAEGGRPRNNGWTDAQVIALLNEGKTIRAISEETGASTYSVQKVKKKFVAK